MRDSQKETEQLVSAYNNFGLQTDNIITISELKAIFTCKTQFSD